jgi:Icc-related predicted phosphoesterase
LISQQGSLNIGYTQTASNFLFERLTAARAESPGKPVFVFMHSPPLNTVFGSGSGSAELTPVLNQFPEAIVFSGHSHQTLGNNQSIFQDKFTAINDGCNTEGRAEAVVAVVQNNGDVALYRWNSRDNVLFLPDWLVEAPHDGTKFKYKQ